MQTIQIEKSVDDKGRVTVAYEEGASIFTTLLKASKPPTPAGIITATMIPHNFTRNVLMAHLMIAVYVVAEQLKIPAWQLLAEVEKNIKEQKPIMIGSEVK